MVTLKLSRPLVVGDVRHEALNLDFDKLTGVDVLMCETEARAASMLPAFSLKIDSRFQQQLAARACGIDADALTKLGARDFVALLGEVQAFLIGTDD